MMESGPKSEARTVDPILNLPVHSSVNSLCFVDYQTRRRPSDSPISNHGNNSAADGDDDSGEIKLRSSTLRFQKADPDSFHNHPHRVLNGRLLASCHCDGEAILWDLNSQKSMATISSPRGGPGLTLRRTADPSQILFQTRDPKGIVTLHSIERCNAGGGDSVASASNSSISVSPPSRSKAATSTVIRQYETSSKTFCQAAPCYGNKHLLALPSTEESTVMVVDERADTCIGKYNISGHGMLTSLAISVTDDDIGLSVGRPILSCGMESGTVIFFDTSTGSRSYSEACFSLGKNPILTLDHSPSVSSNTGTSCHRLKNSEEGFLSVQSDSNALLVAAGIAGDAEETIDAGCGVLFKTIHFNRHHSRNPTWNFEQRARLSTCRVDRESFRGKPGVSVYRFRPNDGRLLAIGGWDFRIRLFERSKGKPMAILKGNEGSIADLDWAPDAITSGLLASATRNGKSISLWQCFAKT